MINWNTVFLSDHLSRLYPEAQVPCFAWPEGVYRGREGATDPALELSVPPPLELVELYRMRLSTDSGWFHLQYWRGFFQLLTIYPELPVERLV